MRVETPAVARDTRVIFSMKETSMGKEKRGGGQGPYEKHPTSKVKRGDGRCIALRKRATDGGRSFLFTRIRVKRYRRVTQKRGVVCDLMVNHQRKEN